LNFVVVTLFYQIFAYLSFLFSELLSNIYCSTTFGCGIFLSVALEKSVHLCYN
jgi:hypothetical protein